MDRIAIVTGGTRGMGKAISFALAQEKTIVYAVYYSNTATANETRMELQKISPSSDVICADVSKKTEVERIVADIGEKHGHIDILVNNAGIFNFCFLDEMTEEYLDRILAVNFKSQVFMLQACIPYLKKSSGGRVINASSISGRFADVGLLGYGASKSSVDMLTKIAAGELAPFHITVNAYAPGIIHTDMTDEMIRMRGTEQVEQIALKRFGEEKDVGDLVVFLASEKSGYITGEIIGIDGGFFKVQNPCLAHRHAHDTYKE